MRLYAGWDIKSVVGDMHDVLEADRTQRTTGHVLRRR